MPRTAPLRPWASAAAALLLAPSVLGYRARLTPEGIGHLPGAGAFPTHTVEEGKNMLFNLEVEAELPADAFACYEGTVFGITLPGLNGKNPTFHYMKHMPFHDGLSFYKDVYEESHHCIVLPPFDDFPNWPNEYRLVCRKHTGAKEYGGWTDNRLFRIGEAAPCEQPGETSEEEEDEDLVLDKPKADSEEVSVSEAKTGAEEQKERELADEAKHGDQMAK